MAKFGKRADDKNTPVEVEADEVLLPGEGPAEVAPTENAETNWQDQLNEAFDTPTENDSTDTTPQEESTMTETTTEATIPAQTPILSLTERLENDGFTVTDAAKTLLAEAENETATPMLDIETLPKDARVVKMQLTILAELADEYKALRKELADGTSGKDEKIAAFLAENDEIVDENDVDLKDALAEAQEARDKAIQAANEAEAALLAHVEAELSKTAGGVMSEEDIAAKTAEIKLKYGEYSEQHKAAKSFLDNYRTHKNAEVGEIHQYVTHIDRPSGRATTAGSTSRNAGPTAGRSVHVSGAFFSRDNGATWIHSTQVKAVNPTPKNPDGKITLSNPVSLATDLGKAFSTTVSKDDIVDAWYSASGQTRETASKANMPDEKVFPMTIKNGAGADVDVLVKLAKRQ